MSPPCNFIRFSMIERSSYLWKNTKNKINISHFAYSISQKIVNSKKFISIFLNWQVRDTSLDEIYYKWLHLELWGRGIFSRFYWSWKNSVHIPLECFVLPAAIWLKTKFLIFFYFLNSEELEIFWNLNYISSIFPTKM